MKNSVSFLKMQEILGQLEGMELYNGIRTIIKIKGKKLDSSDILSIYKTMDNSDFNQDLINKISLEIIRIKQNELEPNDLVYMSHFDKNHEKLKEELLKYLPKNVVDSNVKDWEKNLRESIRKIIKNDFFI
jgi:hypothetical protein